MFAKTFRSAVSVLLVCCLLLGVGGNAVVLAVENPVSGAIDKVDNKVSSIIADLEAAIADLEAQVKEQEQNLADAKDQLNSGKEDLAEAQKTLDEKKELLADAREQLDEVQGMLDKAEETLEELEQKRQDYQDLKDEKQAEKDAAQALKSEKQAELDAKKAEFEAVQAEYKGMVEEHNARVYHIWDLEEQIATMPDGPEKDALQAEVDAEKAEYRISQAALAEYYPKVEEAKELLNDAQTQLDDAQVQLDDAQTQLDDAQTKLDDAKVELEKAEGEVAKAKAEYQKLYDTVDEIEGTINDYQAKIDEINEAVAEAEEALPVAENALAEANEALTAANAVVENIKTTYATLYNAVTDPTVSVAFVKETVSTLYAQAQDVWASVLDLQDALHELIAAYEELEGFAIDPIVIDDYHFAGLVIEPFTVDEYHYGDFHFSGYVFEGYTVDPVTVEGYSFEGFSAPAMPEQLSKISETLDTVISKTVTAVNAIKYYGAIILDKLGIDLDTVIDFVKENLNKQGAVKVYNWLYNNPDKVCALVKEYGVRGLELLCQYGPYALDLLEEHSDLVILGLKATAGATYLAATLGAKVLGYVGDKLDFLADYKDDVIAAASKLYAKYGDEAKALVKVYVEYLQLEERYYNATNGVYVIGGPNLYVALGDDSSESVSYVDKLAAELGVPYENLANADMTIEEAVQANLETLKKADLVTIGYSANTAAKNMIERVNTYMQDKPLEEIDWNALIGEKYGPKIAAALDKLEAKLIAEGLDGKYMDTYSYVELLRVAAEAYVYDYVSYIWNSRNAINDIQAVNDDALIVLVGMYNPFEDVVITHGDKSVNLGKLYDLLIEAVDCYYLAYAFVNDNTIFVNAPAVETSVEAGKIDAETLMFRLLDSTDELDATDAGHEYIKDQIMDALTVKILGDVNSDGKVNNVDAMLVLQYYVGVIDETGLDLDVADVTFNGTYNNCDAMKILQYYVGVITDWTDVPVC